MFDHFSVEHRGSRPLNGPAWLNIDLLFADHAVAHWALDGNETNGYWEDDQQGRQQWAERYVVARVRPVLAELLESCQ